MLVFKILYYWLMFTLRSIPASRAELMRTNERRLKKKLRWVVQHISFYRNIANPTLTSFPVISKAAFNANFAHLNIAGITRDEAYNFALQAEQTGQFRAKLRGLTVGLSTGTSGNRGVFLLNTTEIAQWVAMVFVRVLHLNLLRRERIAFVFRTNSNLYQATSIGTITMRFFPLDLNSPNVLKGLADFNPTVLVAQPSALIRLAGYKKKGELTISPGRVISIAEVLTERDRSYLMNSFGTIIHQVYQCMEGFLAHTCKLGNIHVNEDVVYWEKRYIDPDQRRYHPILTDLARQTQALIRYELNDVLIEPDVPCSCGSPFTHIGQIEGRADDVLLFPDGSGRLIAVFPDLVRRAVCDSSDTIVSYAVYQSDFYSVIVYVDETLLSDYALCQTIHKKLTALLVQHSISGITISFLPYHQREPETKLRRVKRNSTLSYPES